MPIGFLSLQLLRAMCRLPPLSPASRRGSRARTDPASARQTTPPTSRTLLIPYLSIPLDPYLPHIPRARPPTRPHPAVIPCPTRTSRPLGRPPRFPANAAPYARACHSQIPPSCCSPRARHARHARRARPATRRDSPPRFSANVAPYSRACRSLRARLPLTHPWVFRSLRARPPRTAPSYPPTNATAPSSISSPAQTPFQSPAPSPTTSFPHPTPFVSPPRPLHSHVSVPLERKAEGEGACPNTGYERYLLLLNRAGLDQGMPLCLTLQ
jgi:hypothetical protein